MSNILSFSDKVSTTSKESSLSYLSSPSPSLISSSSALPSSTPSSLLSYSNYSTNDILIGLISNYSTNSSLLLPFSPPPNLTSSLNQISFNESEGFITEEKRCSSHLPQVYDPWISSICTFWSILGLVYIFFGYRCLKPVLFLSGFILTTALIYFFASSHDLMPIYDNLLISASAGLLTGLITWLFGYVGIFVIGFNFGCFLGTTIILFIHLISFYFKDISPPDSVWIVFILITGWGIIGAFSALYFQKGCTILYTSFYGSTFIILSIDYFVENFYLFFWILDKLNQDSNLYLKKDSKAPQSLCLISWILIVLWPILTLIGLITQSCGTSKNFFHINLLNHKSSQRNDELNLLKIRKEENKIEQKQRKYRYLYQVRTAHGDIISQQYLQNFQKKKSPHIDRDSLRTINSDLSHLTGYNQSESRTTTMSHVP